MAYCSEMKKWGSEGQKLCENWVCKKCVKISCHPFGISNATTSAATNMLKVLSILLEATTNRSLVEQEVLKPSWISEKKLHFWLWSKISGY